VIEEGKSQLTPQQRDKLARLFVDPVRPPRRFQRPSAPVPPAPGPGRL
jgi:hypothetical protein